MDNEHMVFICHSHQSPKNRFEIDRPVLHNALTVWQSDNLASSLDPESVRSYHRYTAYTGFCLDQGRARYTA